MFLAVKLRLRTVSSELNEVDEQALSIGVIGIGSLIRMYKAAIFLNFSFSRIKKNKIKKEWGEGAILIITNFLSISPIAFTFKASF